MSELPKRDPQQALDRHLSWSGQIQPPRPCTDLDLMARLLAALHHRDQPPEEDST